jgi:hypothetical protein
MRNFRAHVLGCLGGLALLPNLKRPLTMHQHPQARRTRATSHTLPLPETRQSWTTGGSKWEASFGNTFSLGGTERGRQVPYLVGCHAGLQRIVFPPILSSIALSVHEQNSSALAKGKAPCTELQGRGPQSGLRMCLPNPIFFSLNPEGKPYRLLSVGCGPGGMGFPGVGRPPLHEGVGV